MRTKEFLRNTPHLMNELASKIRYTFKNKPVQTGLFGLIRQNSF